LISRTSFYFQRYDGPIMHAQKDIEATQMPFVSVLNPDLTVSTD
jgi:hypothetical protein